ncbi:MAG: encapsulin [Candidatus Zixiibacteriota bacterium]|nr:MAG: encapsulin [candidate division Zixibacteria bacterium]
MKIKKIEDLLVLGDNKRFSAMGSIAAKLLANKMNPNILRTNATLRKDEWKHFDETVVDVARQRMVGVQDLVSRGLSYNLTNGLGQMVLEYEQVSDALEAQMDMTGEARGRNDRVEYTLGYLPLPITHADFDINVRALTASRNLGQSLDTVQAAVAARKVSEKTETILFQGASTYTYGGGTIYGYCDFPSRNTGSLTANWDESGADPVADVIAMKQKSIDDKHYGPWMLYIPTNYEGVLDEDFKANSDITIRERIKKIGNIADVKVADYLTADNVVLVELRPETARIVIGMQPTNVEWQTEGGMIFHFKVMAIMVPQLRADDNGNCGIVHFT